VSVADATSRGFTLIEVLVAISLLALLAIMTWHGLGQVMAQRARIDDGTAETERVLRTLAQLERDLSQRVPDRLFAGRYGAAGVLPLALQLASTGEGADTLSVLRVQRGAPARGVTYAIEDKRLVRSLGEAPGQPTSVPVPMLDRVRRFEVRVLIGGEWVAPEQVQARLKAGTGNAVQISIEREDGVRYVQVVAL
jgi:general secretion pathway protein J